MKAPVIEEIEGEQDVCRHHWLIESPQGATSRGRCKRCGQAKEFRNSAEDTLWEGDPMSSISKMAAGNRPVVSVTPPGPTED